MIKLTYRTLNDDRFQAALERISNHHGFSVKETYNIGKLAERLERETQKARAGYTSLFTKYATKGEDGKLLPPSGENKEKFKEELESFLDTPIEIDRTKLQPSMLVRVGLLAMEDKANPHALSPNEFLALETIVNFDEPGVLDGAAPEAPQDNVTQLKK